MSGMIQRTGLILLAMVVAGMGCQNNKGPSRTARTADNIATVKKDVQEGKAAAGDAINSLNALAATTEGDLRPGYANLRKAIARLQPIEKRTNARAADLRARAQTYFVQWQADTAEIADPALRSRADARRKEQQAAYDKMVATSEEARSAYEPFIADLRDIETYLANDLTADGVKSLDPAVQKANEHANDLMTKLDQVSSDLDEVQRSFSPMATTQPTTREDQ